MVRVSLSLLALPLFVVAKDTSITYPNSHPVDTVETIHGVKVADPYRWLEDLNSDRTRQWIKEQNTLTQKHLNSIPGRDTLNAHLTRLWNVERFGTPQFIGGRYFFSRNDGLQNQSVLYVTESLDATPTVLLDPNKLSDDGTIALKSYDISPDGKFMAYSISKSGSDWVEWKVREIASGTDLKDHLKWSKFSGATWAKDSSGFYYGRFPTPEKGQEMMAENTHKKIYFHKIGAPQSDDKIIYERPDHPKWGLYADLSEDGRYLLITISQGTDTKNGFFYKDLSKPNSKVVELLPKFNASYSFIGNIESTFLIQTDLGAPRQRVVAINLKNPKPSTWRTVIPESAETLRSVSYVGDTLIANYLKDARSDIRRFKTNGRELTSIKLPGLGTAGGFSGKSTHTETFYSFNSFTSPGAVYRYNVASNTSTLWKKPETQFNPDNYETSQIFAESKDGTKVPMFVVHKKNLVKNGQNPTLLYAYGGFNIPILPRYSPATIAWLDMGGLYVSANLRGGGEYGDEWHQAGMKLKKQNVFDDFIACAEHLIRKKYTSSKKLAIHGGSNGGLLVGACLVQRPELYRAAIPAVGVMDMIRFQKFTIGWAWQSEYGFPDDNADEFKYLLGYSPYHNCKPANYPATLITTSDHDDRVVPSHSYKFAAALQAAQKGTAPTIIRIESKSGHGAGTPTSKRIEQAVDKYSFLAKALSFKIKL
ncbi:MAG: prolyl oligopeptidase family serine peptidase [Akkermansiaceae bacterium]